MSKNVLLVDDSKTMRKLAELVFAKTEFTVDCTGDASDALSKLGDASVDLIILDASMPEVDGYMLAKTLRELPAAESTPILLLVDDGGPDEARLAGVDIDGYVVKPFTATELLDPARMLTGLDVRADAPLTFGQELEAKRFVDAQAAELAMRSLEERTTEREEARAFEEAQAALAHEGPMQVASSQLIPLDAISVDQVPVALPPRDEAPPEEAHVHEPASLVEAPPVVNEAHSVFTRPRAAAAVAFDDESEVPARPSRLGVTMLFAMIVLGLALAILAHR